jgi:hypothetical protein
MNQNYKTLITKMDTCGALERAERRERILKQAREAQAELNDAAEQYRAALQRARKAEQVPQEIAYESPAARERGLRSYDPARHRQYDVAKLKELQERDPILFFFRFANSSPETA